MSHPERSRNYLTRFLAWSRIGVTAIAFGVQIFLMVALISWGTEWATWMRPVITVVSVAVLVFILNSRMHIEYKLTWTILILLLPLFGGVFYLLFGSRTGTRRQLNAYRKIQYRARLDQVKRAGVVAIEPGPRGRLPRAWPLQDQRDTGMELEVKDVKLPSHEVHTDAAHQVLFLESMGPFVAYEDTETTYYHVGDDALGPMLEALEGAKHWIGMECFIISQGRMWESIRDVLVRKAADGVEVRLMYDDLGSVWELPTNFLRELRSQGVRVRPVNRFGPGLTLRYNNRDHRKILVVDGVVGFTGGINIADEYINERERYGHWRDTVIRLRGAGAWGLATLFFTLWDSVSKETTDLKAYYPPAELQRACPGGSGVVVSFDDTPFDDYSVGWAAYRNLMTRAHKSVDIVTPYLVPTGEMINNIASVAASGVKVRLVTPGIPDKRIVFEVTRSNYRALVESGVEVYEYSPGFVHAKQMIADDETAIIGTINMDYRSFYLHQENACWMHKTEAIAPMAADFDDLVSRCRQVSLEEVRATPWWHRGLWVVLRTFAPLM